MKPRVISRLADFDFASDGMRRGEITLDEMRFAFHFEHRPGAPTLVVPLSHMVGRQFEPPPSFDPLPWAKRRDFHLLTICDPTLFMDDRIEVGIFQGRIDREPIPGVCRIVEQAATTLGVSNILLWGASGAGFASVKAASLLGCSAAVINTQACMYELRHWAVVQEQARVFGLCSVRDFCTLYPKRSSVLGDLERRTARHVLWAQNVEDDHHYRRHYAKVCAMFGLPLTGGTSEDGRLTALPYASPEGHNTPSGTTHRRILDVALDQLE